MEKMEELNNTIGNEEATKLEPAKVKVEGVNVEEISTRKGTSLKLALTCKHPQGEEPIKISSVCFLSKGKVVTAGLWLNKDSKGLIRKGSAVAVLMGVSKVEKPALLLGLELDTVSDEKGYLAFKGY